MSGQKKSKTFGGTSLPLESIVHEGYEIKSLKHGIQDWFYINTQVRCTTGRVVGLAV